MSEIKSANNLCSFFLQSVLIRIYLADIQFISVIFQPVNYKNFSILIFECSSNHKATKNHWQCLVAINGDGKAYYELLPLQQLNQNWLKRGQRGPEAQRPDITRYLFDQRKWKKQEAQRPRGPRYPKGPKHTETPLTRCYHNEDLIPTELSNTTLDLRGPEA